MSPFLVWNLYHAYLDGPSLVGATLKLKVYDYEYTDRDHHVTTGTVNVALWLFPVLSRVTSGSWLTIRLGDFRILVYTSERTPDWIVQIRRNIFDTTCCGEIIRLDDLKLRTTLSKPNPVVNIEEDEAECVCGDEKEDEDDTLGLEGKVPEVQLEQPPTEGVIDGHAIKWHMVNSRRRMYVFRDVVAQLRRDIDGDGGSFRMPIKDCSWIKMPAVGKQESYVNHLISWKAMLAIARLPFDLYRIYRDPMSAVDIIVSSCDITFDHFRLRDAELGRECSRAITFFIATSMNCLLICLLRPLQLLSVETSIALCACTKYTRVRNTTCAS
ncbi:hypothetical protein M378DRAFT_65784 [Amanita muscaria Koide BX008]|uniref:Uncharacterized protein n=1 Tax=Amanita muscaria (strain Koide BX008) TaxID=946122 RepID=A0A0C2XQF0_AMAMK|nr:hypothetical protein M378DRAFT_65784 [Amanita muscaria Koide BX008]